MALSNLVEDPTDSSIVYCGGDKYVNSKYRMYVLISSDGGATWPTLLPVTPPAQSIYCTYFNLAPSDPMVMYMAGLEGGYGVIYQTTDANRWYNVTNNLAGMLGQYEYINAIWVVPDDPNTVLVGTDAGTFKTTNGGTTWSATPIALETSDFAYCANIETLYAGTADGVYASTDLGATWTTVGMGLGTTTVACLGVDSYNGFLYAGTNGGSTWRCDIEIPLAAYAVDFSAVAGADVDFAIDAPAVYSGRLYVIFGSVTGTEPGLPLSPGVVIPINWDPFTDLIIAMINSPALTGFYGNLDINGMAQANLNSFGTVPPSAVGLNMSFAYALMDFPFDFASNPVSIEILP